MATSKIKKSFNASYNTLLANMAHTTGLDEQSLLDNMSNYGLVNIIVGNSSGAVTGSAMLPVDEFMSHSSNSNLIRIDGDSSSNFVQIKAKSGDYTKIYVQTVGSAYVKVLGIR